MNVKTDRSTLARVDRSNQTMKAAFVAVLFVVGHATPSFASGDAAHGAIVYQKCMICHSLDKNGIGPRHRDVFGRKAGSVADYDYSAALKASNIVWNERALDQWLTSPQALVPGTKMMFAVGTAQDRADVIAFLKEKATSDPPTSSPGEK
jgi:cytochrome c